MIACDVGHTDNPNVLCQALTVPLRPQRIGPPPPRTCVHTSTVRWVACVFDTVWPTFICAHN